MLYTHKHLHTDKNISNLFWYDMYEIKLPYACNKSMHAYFGIMQHMDAD